MILKKPYAFIIKHFRLIHLFLLIPIIYVMRETRGIASFLGSYIKNNYTFISNDMLSNLANHYISFLLYIAIILLLVILIILIIVLQRKQKPVKFYTFSILYYIFLFLFIISCYSVFSMIERDTLDEVMARLMRDISWIAYFSQYILLIMMIVRGSGFNIKKFNFQSDLSNLDITTEDSEEFEFLAGSDGYKTKRKLRRSFREFKYYYQENKFAFHMILLVLVIFLISTFFRAKDVVQTYQEGDSIAFGYINVRVKDSILSSIDLNGKEISKDKIYLVLQLELTNRYREDKTFNYSNLQLQINGEYFTPNLYYGNFFSDYGVSYNGTMIKGNSSYTYLFAYEIPKNLKNSTMQIESNNNYGNKKIRLKPTIINDNINEHLVLMKANASLNQTYLKNSTVSIKDYEITNRYVYEYEYCSKQDNCRMIRDAISIDYVKDYNKTLMALGYDLVLDETSPYFISNTDFSSFFRDFLEIEYIYLGKKYRVHPTVVNPNHYSERLVLKVPREIGDATSIQAIITIRNESYHITLK